MALLNNALGVLFLAEIMLALFSAVYFYFVPMQVSKNTKSITGYFVAFFVCTIFGCITYIIRDIFSDQASSLINGSLYITGVFALKTGIALRQNSNAKPFYKTGFYWVSIMAMILVNVIFLHMIYPSFWLRIAFMTTLVAFIVLTYIPHLNLQKKASMGENVVKTSIYFMAALNFIMPVFYLLTKDIGFYVMTSILCQILSIHIWLGCLSAMMLSDVIQMHYKNSILDPLTSIYNRRYFIDYIQSEEVDHAQTHALIICDLDNFKQLNDTYGHQDGDQVIKSFAQLLKDNISRQDMVARIGGEEFAIFLNNVSMSEAKHIAQRMCDLTKSLKFTFKNTTYTISASFGIAQFGKDCQMKESLSRADKAMYHAKKSGKSQVKQYSSAY